MGTAMVGSLLALAACDDADIETNDAGRLVTTASVAHDAPATEPGNGKASMFGVPREARILFW
jgi:hypothetical protein